MRDMKKNSEWNVVRLNFTHSDRSVFDHLLRMASLLHFHHCFLPCIFLLA